MGHFLLRATAVASILFWIAGCSSGTGSSDPSGDSEAGESSGELRSSSGTGGSDSGASSGKGGSSGGGGKSSGGGSSSSVLSSSIDSSSSAEDSGTLTDSRDGKTYKWTKIGDQVWMAENLNFGLRIESSGEHPGEQKDAITSSAEKFCYNNEEANCDTYGGLYQWHSAMTLPYSCNSQTTGTGSCIVNTPHRGLCPAGWHVPTKAEWATLDSWVDENNDGIENQNEGSSLKSATGWSLGNGTDGYGWAGLPGGRCLVGGFLELKYNGYWWSTSEDGEHTAWGQHLGYDQAFLFEYFYNKSGNGYSLRCVKD